LRMSIARNTRPRLLSGRPGLLAAWGLALLLAVSPARAGDEALRLGEEAYLAFDFALAARHFEVAVSRYTASRGERDPKTLEAISDLASMYGELGRHAERLALNEKAYRLRTEVLGERHPDTLVSMSNLASTYGALGRLEERVALSERSLQLSIEVVGERHPDTITELGSLAFGYGALGRDAEELPLLEKVLRLRSEVQGERHVHTLIALNNLAAAYGERGLFEEQMALAERALPLATERLGPKHPDTLIAMLNLASAYGAMGRRDEQLRLAEQVMHLRTEVRGERHPFTLLSVRQLARHYQRAGRLMEATALTTRYVAGAEWQRSQPGLAQRVPDSSLFRGLCPCATAIFSTGACTVSASVAEGLALGPSSARRAPCSSPWRRSAPAAPVCCRRRELERLDELNRQTSARSTRRLPRPGRHTRQPLEAERNHLAREHEALQSRSSRHGTRSTPSSATCTSLGPADLPGLVPGRRGGRELPASATTELGGLCRRQQPARCTAHVARQLHQHLAAAVEIWRRSPRDRAPLIAAVLPKACAPGAWPTAATAARALVRRRRRKRPSRCATSPRWAAGSAACCCSR
jgi:tetratricopeptide (TPR) repeat protein